MPKARALAFAALLLMPHAGPAAAQPGAVASAESQSALEQRADQVVALFNGEAEPEAMFTDGFLAAVAPLQIKALTSNLTAQFGPAVEAVLGARAQATRAALEVRFERGIAKGAIAIDPAEGGRITELVFTTVDALAKPDDRPEKIAADLAALPGSVNAWFAPLDGSTPVIAIGADQPLALGSTFKLYVLAALAEDVKAGRRKWSDVVTLTEKSFPSGQLQEWPKGSPVTLHTLATLMISISDNTATDQLIAVLGKDRVVKTMQDNGNRSANLNYPFKTTRELFITKANDGLLELLRKARGGDEEAYDVYMTLLYAPWTNPSLEDINAAFASGPRALDIEWFASPADLARLFAHMRATADPEAFEIMAINPSATPAILANWDYIGFKGGSEPGVLNLTWLLTDKAGRDWVLTLGWNNPAAVVNEGQLEGIAQRILLLPR
jgi:hypothetical protein